MSDSLAQKFARRSFEGPYLCLKPWPQSCGVQAGGKGLVIDTGAPSGSYTTAFFEAFPAEPNCDTFIRGEGPTVEEAEAKAFAQYEKFSQCSHASGFERRSYTNGAGFCKDCGMFKSKAFEPTTRCKVCDTPCNWTSDKHGNPYCKEHAGLIPQEDKSSTTLWMEEMDRDMEAAKARRAAKAHAAASVQ